MVARLMGDAINLAAVIGRSFSFRALEEVSERSSDPPDDYLKRPAQADLFRPSLSGVVAVYMSLPGAMIK